MNNQVQIIIYPTNNISEIYYENDAVEGLYSILTNSGITLDVNFIDQPIPITYSISDVRDLNTRNSTFTKQFAVPGTKLVNQLFNNIFEIANSTDFNPNKKLLCQVLQDEQSILVGYLQLKKIKVDRLNNLIDYEVVIYSSNDNLIKNLSGVYLQDLDFSSYNHLYSATTIQQSWTATTDNGGYVYSLIDFGKNWSLNSINGSTPEKCVQFTDFRPSMFLKNIVDAIFDKANYTYTSTFFETDDKYRKVIMPLTNFNHSKEYTENYSFKGSTLTNQYFPAVPFSTSYIQSVTFDDDSINGYNYSGNYNNVTGVYTFTESLRASFNFSLILNFTSPPPGGAKAIIRKTDGGTGAITNIYETAYYNFVLGSTQTININTQQFDFNAGDSVNFVIENFSNNKDFYLISGSTWEMKVSEDIIIGSTLDISSIMPRNIKAIDFLSSVFKTYNLYFEEDKLNQKNIIIEPRDDFYLQSEILDWTDKLDISYTVEQVVLPELQSKNIILSFTEDQDYFNKYYKDRKGKLYAEHSILVDNDFLKEDSTLKIQPLFAPTPLSKVANSNSLIIPKIFKANDSGIAEKIDSKPRLLYWGGIIPCDLYYYYANTNIGATAYPYAGHLDNPISPTFDLNFGIPDEIYFPLSGTVGYNQYTYLNNNLYTNFWQSTIEEMTSSESRLITCYLYLKPADIATLSFRKQIRIDGVVYKINKIIDYNPIKIQSTKVELIKSITNVPANRRSVRYGINVAVNDVVSGRINAGRNNDILNPFNGVFGDSNQVSSSAEGNVIGGFGNIALSDSSNNIISGFRNSGQTINGLMLGGSGNTIIGYNENSGTILGTNNNITFLNSGITESFILGGVNNKLTGLTLEKVFIIGGNNNSIINTGDSSDNSFIIGGLSNVIQTNHSASTRNAMINSKLSYISGWNNNTANTVGDLILNSTSSFIQGSNLYSSIINSNSSVIRNYSTLQNINNNNIFGSSGALIIQNANNENSNINFINNSTNALIKNSTLSNINGSLNCTIVSNTTGRSYFNNISNSVSSSIELNSYTYSKYNSISSSNGAYIGNGATFSSHVNISNSTSVNGYGKHNTIIGSRIVNNYGFAYNSIIGSNNSNIYTGSYYSSILSSKRTNVTGRQNVVIGGDTHTINGGTDGVIILGGVGWTPSQSNTTYVDQLNIATTNSGGTYMLTIDGSGFVYKQDIPGVSSGSTSGITSLSSTGSGQSIIYNATTGVLKSLSGGNFTDVRSDATTLIIDHTLFKPGTGSKSFVLSGTSSTASNTFGWSAGQSNTNTGQYSTIVNGLSNTITANHSVIHGRSNSIASNYSVIGGGKTNLITSTATTQTIAGGYQNVIKGTGSHNAILGGATNIITGTSFNTIGGGQNNLIEGSIEHSFIGGGNLNSIKRSSLDSAIVGGLANNILNSTYSFVGGGRNNYISGATTITQSFIGGGFSNRIYDTRSTIAGGYLNKIKGVSSSFIGGGGGNTISGSSSYATIAGGRNNKIYTLFQGQVIAGGRNNTIFINSASMNTIAGGYNNKVYGSFATIGGGSGNKAGNSTGVASYAVIGGGKSNIINLGISNSVIAGGISNIISGNTSVIAGGSSNTGATAGSVIGGGQQNFAGRYTFNTIAGGYQNKNYGGLASVGGGKGNIIGTSSQGSLYAVIGGGLNNIISPGAGQAVIAGGTSNSGAGQTSFIGGGGSNRVGFAGVVVGGVGNNNIGAFGFIGGGSGNTISTFGDKYNVIGGGYGNYMGNGVLFGSILTGKRNRIQSSYGVVIGGSGNSITTTSYSTFSTIINGQSNTIPSGKHSTILNGTGNTISAGSNAHNLQILGGHNVAIKGSGLSHITVIGMENFTATTNSSVHIPKLYMYSATTGGTHFVTYSPNADKQVFYKSLSAGTNITITDSGSNILIDAGSAGATFVQPGTNTYTGGTSTLPTVNISGGTFNNLSVTGSTLIFSTGTTVLTSSTSSHLLAINTATGQVVKHQGVKFSHQWVGSIGAGTTPGIIWTNQPANKTTWLHQTSGTLTDDATYYTNLNGVTECRLSVGVQVAGAGATTLLAVEQSLDGTNWNSLVSLTIGNTTGLKSTSWTSIPTSAMTDTYIRLVGQNGNGTADPRFSPPLIVFR